MKIQTSFFAFIAVAAAALAGASAAQAFQVDGKKLVGAAYFKMFNADKSKKISLREYNNYNKLFFISRDRNKDGVLDLSEMPSNVLGPASLNAPFMDRLSSMSFRENFGCRTGMFRFGKVVSVEELFDDRYGKGFSFKNWKQDLVRRERAGLLQLLDADKDSKVTEEEFILVMEQAFHQFDNEDKDEVLEGGELPRASNMPGIRG